MDFVYQKDLPLRDLFRLSHVKRILIQVTNTSSRRPFGKVTLVQGRLPINDDKPGKMTLLEKAMDISLSTFNGLLSQPTWSKLLLNWLPKIKLSSFSGRVRWSNLWLKRLPKTSFLKQPVLKKARHEERFLPTIPTSLNPLESDAQRWCGALKKHP